MNLLVLNILLFVALLSSMPFCAVFQEGLFFKLHLSGEETEYDVSGITAYKGNSGLSYNDTYYAGAGDEVSLTLDHAAAPTGYTFNGYTASAGTLENNVLTMPAGDVCISASFVKAEYNITVADTDHGTVTAPQTAHYEDTVTLTVQPDEGYSLKTLTVTDADDNEIEVTNNQFTMPDNAVTITAVFDTLSTFDADTGTLILKGDLVSPGVRQSIILPNGVSKDDVLHIVVDEEGATFPKISSFLFQGFSNVETIDLTRADTGSVTDMRNMFANCTSLTSVDLSSFDTGSVTDMSAMFVGCTSLTSVDLSSFDTGNVTDIESMFTNCTSLTSLDLSSFDTRNVRNMKMMFMMIEESSLTTIYVGENWATQRVRDHANMFQDCEKLIGGAGTSYSDDNVGKQSISLSYL